LLGLGTEEVDGGGAASGDEAEELGAEEFAATPAVVAHLESRRRRSPAVVTHLDSGVQVEEKLDRGRWSRRRRQRRRLQMSRVLGRLAWLAVVGPERAHAHPRRAEPISRVGCGGRRSEPVRSPPRVAL